MAPSGWTSMCKTYAQMYKFDVHVLHTVNRWQNFFFVTLSFDIARLWTFNLENRKYFCDCMPNRTNRELCVKLADKHQTICSKWKMRKISNDHRRCCCCGTHWFANIRRKTTSASRNTAYESFRSRTMSEFHVGFCLIAKLVVAASHKYWRFMMASEQLPSFREVTSFEALWAVLLSVYGGSWVYYAVLCTWRYVKSAFNVDCLPNPTGK